MSLSQGKLIVGGSLLLLIGMLVMEAVNKPSESSFVAVATPNGVDPQQVVVVGPIACNSPAGTRTKELTDKLTASNIPHKHIAAFSVTNTEDWDGIDRLNQIMKRDSPIVFIQGKAKANPKFEEVVAEYGKVKGQ